MTGPEGTTHGAVATSADAIDAALPGLGGQTVLVSGYPPDLVAGDYLRMASLGGGAALRWQEVHHTEDVFGSQTKVCFQRPGETRPGRMGAFLLDNDARVQIARPVVVGDVAAGRLRLAWRLARSWTRRFFPWTT